MSQRKLHDAFENLEKAVGNLERALLLPREQELVLEGTIQRFDTGIELFWKCLKRALEFEGLRPSTPRESVREAFRIGWLHDERSWLDMLDSRNRTSHQYLDDALVRANYDDIKRVTPTLRAAVEALVHRYRGPDTAS